jgi:hypothetical protein
MIKNGKKQNVVATTWEQNMGAAKTCATFNEAVSLFRALQYANDMGTGGPHFDELEEHFIEKQGLMSYLEDGLTVAQASNKADFEADPYYMGGE